MSYLLLGDCMDVMPSIPSCSVDMILCDLPYGMTGCDWDTIIPLAELWSEYKRIAKPNAAIVLTASQPFTSQLVMSNPSMFKYELIWCKNTSSGMATAKNRPMKRHENILVFYSKQPTYNPIKLTGSAVTVKNARAGYKYKNTSSEVYSGMGGFKFGWNENINPHSLIEVGVVGNRSKTKVHPSQKPVALFEWLIKTYTNEGDTVLDNCAGSGTTGAACINTGRDFILIEKEQKYFDIMKERLK